MMGPILEQAGIESQRRQKHTIIDRQMDRSARVQERGAGQVLDEAGNMAPGARMAAMQSAEDATAARTQQDLQGAYLDTAQQAGQAPGDFLKAKADRALAEGNRATSVAREMAKVRSVGQVQQQGDLSRSSLAEALQSMYNSNQQRAQAASLDADNVDVPWYGKLGAVISQVGRAAMSGGGGGGGWAGR